MMKCIAIDDEPLALDLLEDNISMVPYLQLTGKCNNAFEAMEILRHQSVDLIFLDIQLPKKDGYTIIKELRENSGSKNSTIIAITANVMKQDIKRAREAGFDGFIGKPIDGRRFSETVLKILAGETVWTIQ